MKRLKYAMATLATILGMFASVAHALPALPRGDSGGTTDVTCGMKNNVYTCTAPESKGHPITTKAKACIMTCQRTNGVWICKGNGQQCNGVDPWEPNPRKN